MAKVLFKDGAVQFDGTGKVLFTKAGDDPADCACCGGCCDYTVTVTNCPALNGSYDVTNGVDYDDGSVNIIFVEPSSLIIQDSNDQSISITAIGDRGASGTEVCPDAQGWTADDWDGCGGGTPGVAVACT